MIRFCACMAVAFVIGVSSIPGIFGTKCFAGELRLMTINVRFSTANDGPNSWQYRKEFMMDVVRAGDYDFIGGQEVMRVQREGWDQLKYMTENLPGYGVIGGTSREITPDYGEASPIWYRQSRFEVDPEDHGTFWLSDTPEVRASNTWGAALPRVVSWGLFHEIDATRQRTGKSVYVFNTHFDHRGDLARQKSTLLIMQRIVERKNQDAAVVFMGDINAGMRSPLVRFLKGYETMIDGALRTAEQPLIITFFEVHPNETNVATFNGFREPSPTGEKIDYIFVLPGTQVKDAAIIRDQRNGRFPTDHFPVTATIVF